jgi:hypothetical protein
MFDLKSGLFGRKKTRLSQAGFSLSDDINQRTYRWHPLPL